MRHIFLALSFLLVTSFAYAGTDEFRMYTEEYPPYNFWEDNRLNGTSTEIVRAILEKTDLDFSAEDIRLVPWARAYYETLNRNNTAIYSIARTEEREKLFKWVGPIACARIGVVARKSSKVIVDELKDIEKYNVGVVREDVGHQLLRQLLPSLNMDISNSSESNLLKLEERRIELFVYDLDVVNHMLTKVGMHPDDFKTVYILDEIPFYIGFNLETDGALLEKFERAYDEFVKNEQLPTCQ